MTTDQFMYFDLPAQETVLRWLSWGLFVGLFVSITYLAVTA